MPQDNDNQHLATAVATGVALAAAGGFAVYSYFANKTNNPNSGHQNYVSSPNRGYIDYHNAPRLDGITRPTSSTSSLQNYNSSDSVERTIMKCDVCSREIKEDHFGLHCDHEFHKRCLLAKYILSLEHADFKCPVQNCNVRVPEDKKKALTQAENAGK